MSDDWTEFALVDDGTPRALVYFADGSSAVRLLDATWAPDWPTADEVVTPEELGEFRRASSTEFSALAQEARALVSESPMRASPDRGLGDAGRPFVRHLAWRSQTLSEALPTLTRLRLIDPVRRQHRPGDPGLLVGEGTAATFGCALTASFAAQTPVAERASLTNLSMHREPWISSVRI